MKGLLKNTRFFSIAICSVILLLGIGGITYASDSYNIKSNGIIRVDGNNDGAYISSEDVIFDANDLEKINTIVENGKASIAEAINLYPDKVVPETATFANMYDAINSLTTLPSGTYYYVKGTEGSSAIERYKKIDNQFYECNADGTVDIGRTPTDVSSKELVEYTFSENKNLSAGKAGYINKNLVLGDGTEVNASYNQGFIDGQQNVIGNLQISYTYHEHVGSEGSASNGCYTKPIYHAHTSSCYTSRVCGNIVQKREYYVGHSCHGGCISYYNIDYGCSGYGAITGDRCGGGGNSCGRVSGQISGQHVISSLTCGKTTSTIEKYELGCGKTTDTIDSATIYYY